MPLYADRVQETSTTTGTGSLTLAGAVSGYRTFTSAIATGDRVRYVIQGGAEWEVGDGVLTGATTLTRENVYASSNSGSLVTLSAGTKNVFLDLPSRGVCDVGMTAAIVAKLHAI